MKWLDDLYKLNRAAGMLVMWQQRKRLLAVARAAEALMPKVEYIEQIRWNNQELCIALDKLREALKD